ncbi:T9SS type A sorting domain-containing protein [Pontibacter sp. BT310]|uniref:T9SS type A sorting domain-containing protein n=1 Tax=Pontibacter populi TaxID=890055 RepID=A0ABS6X5Y6_9BACT|nr:MULTISPECIES: alpha-amylase family glycosyl hydrolase [Pontibacter]MBJ6116564.1 T9SS type A sorting domain-containing protein [Pontibacter sp. BT310]MBR0568988.1 T9SS type A sorting domain-containing protein [Microvirga sp. STS03]MBW3363417.1 T9SS type A sorting domain-containing protein [Pontibacter populi]
MRQLYAVLILVISFFVCLPVAAQVVTVKPVLPTSEKPVTLIFDISKAKDSRAASLINTPNDIYLWSGAGSTDADADAFKYEPAGQTNWAAPFTPGKMTYLGNNRWSITLTPRTYYGVPAGTPIRKLGLLLKNATGTAQTENFYVSLYPATGIVGAFVSPSEKAFFTDANTTIPVKAYTSVDANLRLKVDNTIVYTQTDKDSLIYSLNTGTETGLRRTVVFEATLGTESATDTFFFTNRPVPPVAQLPANAKDGVVYTGPDKALLTLFAPNKKFVYAIGEFSNWEALPEYLMKRTPDGNRYWVEIDGLETGKEIAYQYLVDGTIAVADPYTHKILDPNNDKYLTAANYPRLKPYPTGAKGIVSVLQTNQPTYNWKVKDFKRPAADTLVVYELLLRDFLATQNYETLADTLTYLKTLGVNAIELMPIMEFSGNISWGYNPNFYFAPDKAYGTANQLKAFIDKAHEMGIAVILDMVLNQADWEFPYMQLYRDGDRPAANNPFLNQQATHPFSVFFDFNHESEATKAFVERVNRYWLEEFKFDGFRFDLSKGFTQKNSGTNVGAWSAYDAGRVATWKRIYDEIRSYDKTAYVILEHFADNTEEKELANYGMMFWGNINHEYRDFAKSYDAYLDDISYKTRGWKSPYLIGYMESHDEERIMFDVKKNGRSSGNYNTRNLETALDRAKLAAAFFIPVPGPKMIWQFGELGYDVSIDSIGRTDPKPIRWNYRASESRMKLYKVYAELINLKKNYPVFRTTDFNLASENMIKRLTLVDNSMTVFIIGNYDVKQQTPQAGFPLAGTWYDHFTGETVNITNPTEIMVLQPGEFRMYTSVKLPSPEPNLLPWKGVVLDAEDELPLAERIEVYPNPTQHIAQLEFTDDYRGDVSVQVTDITGHVLRTVKFKKHQQSFRQSMDLRNVAAGVYLVQIEAGKRKVVKRLVKLN